MDKKIGLGKLSEPESSSGGRLLNFATTGIASFRHIFYEAAASVARHRHDRATLIYGVGGPCVEWAPDGALVTRRFIYRPPGFEHALHFLGPAHLLVFEIPHSDGMAPLWPEASVPLPATLYDHVWRVLLAVEQREPEKAVNRSLGELLQQVGRFAEQSPQNRVMQVIESIHGNWREVPRVTELARHCGVSPQYLRRAFKRFTGVSIQRYSVLLRLDYARGMLWGTGMPISQVAAEAGFSDQSHLTRALVTWSQKTPQRLRNAARHPPVRSLHA